MWRINYQCHFLPVHLITLAALIASALGDIRCFCNLSHCVQTGYMCKSVGPEAACYSEYLGPKLSNVHHGCIEKLPVKLHAICGQSAEVARDSGSQRLLPSRFPSLLCCRDDLCNYVRLDNSIDQHHNQSQKDSYSQSSQAHSWPDMWWFKVAVIAVPLVLSFVLVALILLARQLLRQGTKRHSRQDQQVRKQRDRQFAPPDLLLMTSNSCDVPTVPLKSAIPGSATMPDVDHIYSRTTGNFAQQSTFRPFLDWTTRPNHGISSDLTLV